MSSHPGTPVQTGFMQGDKDQVGIIASPDKAGRFPKAPVPVRVCLAGRAPLPAHCSLFLMCQVSATPDTPWAGQQFDLSIIDSELHGASRWYLLDPEKSAHPSHSFSTAQRGAAAGSPDLQFAAEGLAPLSCPGSGGPTSLRARRADAPVTRDKNKRHLSFL